VRLVTRLAPAPKDDLLLENMPEIHGMQVVVT